MRHSYLLFISALIVLAGCKDKKDADSSQEIGTISPGKSFSDTASSFVRVFDQNGRVCIQQSNTYYELTDVYDGTEKIPLLLKIKKTELCFADSINKSKVYEIEANNILDSRSVHWQNKFVATGVIQLHFGATSEKTTSPSNLNPFFLDASSIL